MMGGAPAVSPWGAVEHCALLCPGVYEVSTASHGGIMVRMDASEQFLTAEARAVGFREGGELAAQAVVGLLPVDARFTLTQQV